MQAIEIEASPDCIKMLRSVHGISRGKLGAMLGCGYHAIYRWEDGSRRVPRFLARALRDVHRELTQAAQRQAHYARKRGYRAAARQRREDAERLNGDARPAGLW